MAASGLDFTSEHGQAQLDAIHRLGEGGKLGVMIGAAGPGKRTLVAAAGVGMAGTGPGRLRHRAGVAAGR